MTSITDVYILNIETSTKNCSVSVAKNGTTIALREIAEEGYSHAEKLHVFIEEIIKESKIKLTNLNAVAISQGPGSYTGLRIGVSSAKGLCFALHIPLIAIDTLQSLAAQLHGTKGVIIPMLDARRMEVFTASYNEKLEQTTAVTAEIITENSFQDTSKTLHLIGDGAPKCKPILHQPHFVYHDEIKYPSAREMSRLSFEKYKKSDTVDVAYFEPLYGKDFMITSKKS